MMGRSLKFIALAVLAASCLARTAPSEIDGQDAAKRMKAFLRKVGVSGELKLNQLSQIDGKSWGVKGKVWIVGFNSPDGTWSGYVDTNGRVHYVTSYSSTPPAIAAAGPPLEKQAWNVLGKLGSHPPVELQTVQLTDGEAFAIFHCTVDGRKLFNSNPLYGYVLKFLPGSQRLTYLVDEHEPPTPNANVAKTDEAKAKSILTECGKRSGDWDYAHRFAKVLSGSVEMRVELGYYKFPGEPTARLVYQGKIWFSQAGRWNELKPVMELVDALTGQTLNPDYNNTGR